MAIYIYHRPGAGGRPDYSAVYLAPFLGPAKLNKYFRPGGVDRYLRP